MNKKLVSKLILACLIAAGLIAVAAVDSTANAESIAGTWMWLARAADDPGHAVCEANNAGSECVELCRLGPTQPTNMLCCLEPWKIGGLDSPEECEYWLH